MKRKNRMIRWVRNLGIFIMILGVSGHAAAGDPAFSEALYANPPPFSMTDRDAFSYRLVDNPVLSVNNEDSEIKSGLLPVGELMLPQDEGNQIEREPAKIIGPHSFLEPTDLYSPTDADRPLSVLGWDRKARKLHKWNFVFGPGLYISNYRDWYHPEYDFGLEAPESGREQLDLFEEIQNALQTVGFQIRYDF